MMVSKTDEVPNVEVGRSRSGCPGRLVRCLNGCGRAGCDYRHVARRIQGPTGLTLTIEGDTPHALKGNFRFYPTPDNARPARGDYEVAVSFDPASLRIEVQGTRWIDQPPGYEFANLRGVLQGRQLIGTVENAGCGAFELTRTGS